MTKFLIFFLSVFIDSFENIEVQNQRCSGVDLRHSLLFSLVLFFFLFNLRAFPNNASSGAPKRHFRRGLINAKKRKVQEVASLVSFVDFTRRDYPWVGWRFSKRGGLDYMRFTFQRWMRRGVAILKYKSPHQKMKRRRKRDVSR